MEKIKSLALLEQHLKRINKDQLKDVTKSDMELAVSAICRDLEFLFVSGSTVHITTNDEIDPEYTGVVMAIRELGMWCYECWAYKRTHDGETRTYITFEERYRVEEEINNVFYWHFTGYGRLMFADLDTEVRKQMVRVRMTDDRSKYCDYVSTVTAAFYKTFVMFSKLFPDIDCPFYPEKEVPEADQLVRSMTAEEIEEFRKSIKHQ